jgi:Rha family phage regulatory protein
MDLVKMRGKDAVCDSLDVAEHFGKRHKNMIQNIERLAENSADVKKLFKVQTYTDSYGREQKKYFMNRDGFSLLVMGFTGQAALEWKLKYIEAFNQMEQLLAQKQTQVYKDARSYQKAIRQQETNAIRSFVEYAESQGSSNAARYYTSLSKLADKTAGITDRERATMEQLGALALIENIIARCILDGIDLQEPYKDIYLECKRKLEQFRTAAFIQ